VASKKTSRSPKSSSNPTDTPEVKAARPARVRAAAAQAAASSEPVAAAAQASEAKPASRKSPARKAPARRPAKQAVAATNGDTPAVPRQAVTDEDIRVRAYFLSLEHRGEGSDVDFWLIAERELRSRAASRD
jgi:Protein of unknown function (DUF2934)